MAIAVYRQQSPVKFERREDFTKTRRYICTLGAISRVRPSSFFDLDQGCATGGPRATTRPARPFNVALGNF